MTADELLRAARHALSQRPSDAFLAAKIKEYFEPKQKRLMIQLTHGRYDPKEDMESWGFDGPTLYNVEWVACTYNCFWRVSFETEEACQFAKTLTGWEEEDERQLRIRFEEDMVKATDGRGRVAYYGDWSIDPET